MTIATLIVDVQAQTASIDSQVKQLNSTLDSMASSAGVAGSAVSALGGYLAGAFSVGAIVETAREVTAFAGHMDDLSQKTGIGVEQLQALNYAASGSGVQIDSLASAVDKLAKNLITGNSGAVDAVAALGLSTKDLIDMSPDQAFIAIATAIAKVPNPMEQAALAIELFGKSGADLLPLLKSNIADLTAEAEKNGAVVSKDLIEKGDELDDLWSHLVIRGKALLADVLIPIASMKFNSGDLQNEAAVVGEITDQLAKMQSHMANPLAEASMPNMTNTIMSLHDAEYAMKAVDDQTKEHIRVADEAAKKQEAWNEKITEGSRALEYWALTGQIVVPTAKNMSGAIDGALPNFLDLNDVLKKIPEAMYAWPPALQSAGASLQAIAGSFNAQFQKIGATLGEDLFDNFGPTLQRAFEGGGNALVAIGAKFGENFTKHVFGSDESKTLMTDTFGKSLGGMVNDLLPGVGALVGPLVTKIGGLFAHLFDPGAAEREANNAASASIKQLEDQLLAQYGTLDNIRGMAGNAGAALAAAWGDQSQAGLKNFQSLLDTFNGTMSNTFDGAATLSKANDIVKQVQDAGGAAVLTASEMATVNSTLQEALEKYAALGQTAPQSMIDLEKATEKAAETTTAAVTAEGVAFARAGVTAKVTLQDIVIAAQNSYAVSVDAYNKLLATGTATVDQLGAASKAVSDAITATATAAYNAWAKTYQYINSGGSGVDPTQGALSPENYSTFDDWMSAYVHFNQNASHDQIAAAWRSNSVTPAWAGDAIAEGYAGGTGGRFIDFGGGRPVMLHGREEVRTEAQGRSDAGLLAELRGMRTDFKKLPRMMRDAMLLAPS